MSALMTPRPIPVRTVPLAAALGALALALPVFLLAGWPVAGWALGALLFAGLRALGLLFDRIGSVGGRLWMIARVLAVTAVLLALLGSDPDLAVATALVYALAYSLELAVSLLLYFGGES